MPFPKHYPPPRGKKPTEQPPPQTPEKPSEKHPRESFRSNSQVICPGRHTFGKSCRIKSHPTVPGGRYCARHQKLCHRCEGSPRHKLTEKCHSCMDRWKKEEREAKKKN